MLFLKTQLEKEIRITVKESDIRKSTLETELRSLPMNILAQTVKTRMN